MRISRFTLSLLIILLAGVGYLSFEILRPFLSSLVWAVLLAVILYPVYPIFHKYIQSSNLASLISVTRVLLMILGPLAYLLYLLLVEISSVSAYLQNTKFALFTAIPLFFTLNYQGPYCLFQREGLLRPSDASDE